MPERAAANPSRPWSISGRLAQIHALKTLAILAGAGGVLYLGLARELRNQDAKLVASKLSVLEHLVATYPAGSEAIRSEIEHEAGGGGPLRYFLRISDPSGGAALETPGMPAELPAAAFPVGAQPAAAALACDVCRIAGGGRYLVAARAVPGYGASSSVLIQVALDVGRTSGVLYRYRGLLSLVLGAGVVLSALSSLIVARLAVRPVRDIADRVRAITASHLDLPHLSSRPWPRELQGLASDFDQMLGRLGDAFSRLSDFTSDLAHALRNPIHNLRGSAEVALSRTRTPDEYQQTLGSSLEELDRLSRLIDGLLFIARAEDPRQAIEHSTFSVRQELDAVQAFYEALAAERGVRTHCEGDALVTGDPMLVRRAVSNLMANALKHTPAGGAVRLLAESRPDGGATITVRDNGSGIGAAHLPFVFDRFYRAEEGLGDPTGAGLGLAIVRSVMRLHGGEARLASAATGGTTVTLEFPPPSVQGVFASADDGRARS